MSLAAVAVASFAIAPAQAADVVPDAGHLMTPLVQLHGDGLLTARPVLVELSELGRPVPGRALIHMVDATLIRYTDMGAATSLPPTEHTQTLDEDGEVVGRFHDATFQFTEAGAQSVFKIRCHGFLETTFPFSGGVSLQPPPLERVGAQVGKGSVPRDQFEVPPDGLAVLRQTSPQAAFFGSFDVLIENARFVIADDGEKKSFATERTRYAAPGGAAWVQTWYVLRVQDGVVHAGAIPSTMLLRSESYHVAHNGAVKLQDASGTLRYADLAQGVERRDVELSGSLDATSASVKKAEGDYALRFDFTRPAQPASAPPGAISISLAGGWLPLAGVFGAVGLSGVALYSWRNRSAGGPATSAPKASARADPPRHSAVAHMENTYRADPGNSQAALELGLTYGRVGRHEEALPLLLLSIQSYPKVEALRYQAALSLLAMGREDEGAKQLEYAFRLNPLNVARFLKEGPASEHGRKPPVANLLLRWSRNFHDWSNRGYA